VPQLDYVVRYAEAIVRTRPTVLIEVPAGIEALLDRDALGAWPRSARLARVVNDVYAHPTHRERLAELSRDLVSRRGDALGSRRDGSLVSMHLTPRLAAQLRALDRAQRQLRHASWEARPVSWEDRDPQERAFLSIRPLGSLWKQVGRKQVKIQPKPRRTLPVSVRFPPALYEEVTAYAKRLGADRTYVVVECVRQTLDADRAWKREWRKLGGG
jgi:hypothetical protein